MLRYLNGLSLSLSVCTPYYFSGTKNGSSHQLSVVPQKPQRSKVLHTSEDNTHPTPVVYELLHIVYELLHMVYGLLHMVYGLLHMVCGLLHMVYEILCLVYGHTPHVECMAESANFIVLWYKLVTQHPLRSLVISYSGFCSFVVYIH